MSKIRYFLIAIMAIFLASCQKEVGTITPDSTSVNGNLSSYYEVVDKDYFIAENGALTLEVKRVKDGFPNPWHAGMKQSRYAKYSNEYELVFRLSFYDEKGNLIVSGPLNSDAEEALGGVENGGIAKVSLTVSDSLRKKAVSFAISGKIEFGEDTPPSSEITEPSTETTDASSETATEEATEENSSSSSEDYDAVLDEYEEYTKKLVSMAKKLEAGDMTVYADYMGLVESMTSLDKKLANAKSEMTNAQTARFLRIQAKYLKALSKAK